MVNISSYAILIGEQLQNSKLASCFSNREVGKQSIDQSSLLIHAQGEFEDQRDLLTNFLEIILSKMPVIEEVGIQQVIVHLNLEYTGQCNWELTPLQLSLLNKIKAVFTFTAYEGSLE